MEILKDKIFQAHFILGGIIAIFVCQIIVYFYLINSLLNRGSKFLASFKLSISFDLVSVLILHSIGTYFIVKIIRHLVKYIKENNKQ